MTKRTSRVFWTAHHQQWRESWSGGICIHASLRTQITSGDIEAMIMNSIALMGKLALTEENKQTVCAHPRATKAPFAPL